MKKSLILVIALLCMASLMAAMAYTTATVENAGSLTVSNTDDALLALEAGDHGAAGYHYNSKGMYSRELKIDWANGEHGIQSGSIYSWDNLFKVTNNSDHDAIVKINIPYNDNIGPRVKLRAGDNGELVTVAGRGVNDRKTLTFNLGAGEATWIDSELNMMARVTNKGVREFKIMVSAERIGEVVE